MRLGVAATPAVALPTLDWLLKSEHEVALVITQPDRPAGRGRLVSASIIAEWAVAHGIQLLKPESAKELIGKIEDLDLVLTIGYGLILPELILDLPKYGFLNLHFSLLPAYRGAAPAQRALENGELHTGVTVFKLAKGIDTGPIYTQKSLTIDRQWRSAELLAELAQLGVPAISEAFEMIQAELEPTPQVGVASMAAKISKGEAQLDFTQTAEQIVRRVKAFTYQPGAWTIWKGQVFKVSHVIETHDCLGVAGEIFLDSNKVIVKCGAATSIELLEVTPAGKKEMKAIAWARGARLSGGERFG